MGKILLFYKYVDIEYPKRVLKWQAKICADLDLHGRIIIGHEGINGTVGGTVENTERYKQIMLKNELFTDVDFKESVGDKSHFPRMQIVVKDEIVHLGLDPQKYSAKDGGIHLTPDQAHAKLAQSSKDLVVFDARNNYESQVGTFKNAVTPDIRYFRELPEYIDKNLDQFKDKEVIMFCTGGVRCERATTYLKSHGVAKEVYQIEGGIHRYVEQYPDGFFRGKNYVFDQRVAVRVNDDIIGNCLLCNVSCDEYANCLNAKCNRHFICCGNCLKQYAYACSAQCQELVRTKQVQIRPDLRALYQESLGQ